MVVIQIDVAPLLDDFSFTQEQVNNLMDYTVKELTSKFAAEWENEANNSLKSSRQQYINSIVVVDEGFAKGAVMLVGELPNMVESGVDNFDMKEGMLNGPNAKESKDGTTYNTIPYQHGTPGSLPENFSGGVMPKEVHAIAKSHAPKQPVKKDELPKKFQAKQKKNVVMPKSKAVVRYQHKNSIYEGISKQKDARTGQNTYISFRRVSENSDPASWIHPGIEAHDIASKALNNFDIPSQTSAIFDQWWSENKK